MQLGAMSEIKMTMTPALVRATFANRAQLRGALRTLREAIAATEPEVEEKLQIKEEEAEEAAPDTSTAPGAAVGAAAGAVIGAAISVAAAALVMPAALPPFVLLGLGGMSLGALGGIIAALILNTGHDLQRAVETEVLEKEQHARRILVVVRARHEE